MPSGSELRALLLVGDRRTVGQVAVAVKLVLREPGLVAELVRLLFDREAGVRMRAADALEKVSREWSDAVQPLTGVLLELFEGTKEAEVCWHLAVVLPRLALDAGERRRVWAVLEQCLEARSALVRTFALQGMVDLLAQEPARRPQVIDRLRIAERTGTAAMKARSRKLLRTVEMWDGRRGSVRGTKQEAV